MVILSECSDLYLTSSQKQKPDNLVDCCRKCDAIVTLDSVLVKRYFVDLCAVNNIVFIVFGINNGLNGSSSGSVRKRLSPLILPR